MSNTKPTELMGIKIGYKVELVSGNSAIATVVDFVQNFRGEWIVKVEYPKGTKKTTRNASEFHPANLTVYSRW